MRGTIPEGRFGATTAEINVTPMIDVMLVLLIIFMVITPGLVRATLPAAHTSTYERERHPTLIVDARGAYSIDVGRRFEAVPDARLQARLAEVYAARPVDHVLYLKADRDASYARVLTALDAARAAGVTRIGAVTEQPPAKARH
ncbi:MAG TPA: biopolymer transporter ExbD [Longimicrobium sp.]|jgi:biopolymer transport protein TolR|nr:biopolymer transporter ExbD [Longimicrobium sp.]